MRLAGCGREPGSDCACGLHLLGEAFVAGGGGFLVQYSRKQVKAQQKARKKAGGECRRQRRTAESSLKLGSLPCIKGLELHQSR